jgi:hypothetical protein
MFRHKFVVKSEQPTVQLYTECSLKQRRPTKQRTGMGNYVNKVTS